MTALSLSVGFDHCDPDFGASDIALGSLVVGDPTSPCFGWTVQQVLDQGNAVLAGLPSIIDASAINGCLSRINENFVDGQRDEGFLVLP